MDIEQKLRDFQSAFSRLKEAYQRSLSERYSEDFSFFRDSTIQRFEFTVEIFWKTIKSFLKIQEGVSCLSPKSCIRELYSLEYITEEETRVLLEMIDYRNLTSHTYHEEVAQAIFKNLHNYIQILEKILNILQTKVVTYEGFN